MILIQQLRKYKEQFMIADPQQCVLGAQDGANAVRKFGEYGLSEVVTERRFYSAKVL